MRFNNKTQIKAIVLTISLICINAKADGTSGEKTNWDLISFSSDKAYWDEATKAVESQLEYIRAKKELASINSPMTEASEVTNLKDQLKSLGFIFKGDRVVKIDKGQKHKPIKKKEPKKKTEVFGWKRISMGSISGIPSVELRKISSDEIITLIDGEIIDGWKVLVHKGRVLATKSGRRIVL